MAKRARKGKKGTSDDSVEMDRGAPGSASGESRSSSEAEASDRGSGDGPDPDAPTRISPRHSEPSAPARVAPADSGVDPKRLALLGIGGSALAFVLFGGLSTLGGGGSSDPYDAMPKGSFLVANVDVDELRKSPVFEAVFGKDSSGSDPMRAALGMGPLAEACGFDPLSRMHRLAVSLPEEGDKGEFGLAAKVDVTRDELEKCTRALADKRGGDGSKTPETKQVGSFVVVDGSSSTSSSARPRLGYGRAGVLVVGKGTWFDAMIGAADHVKPSVKESAEHPALRSSLVSHDGFRAPTLVVTAILPRSLRDRLRTEMGSEVNPREPSNAVMAGVLGVSSIGGAIHAGGPNQSFDAAIELVCDDAPGCEQVEKLILKKRLEWSKDLTLRMVGLGPLVDALDVKREGARLRATSSTSATALAATVERILRLRGGGKPSTLPVPAAGQRDERPDERPDERIPSKGPAHPEPDGGGGGG